MDKKIRSKVDLKYFGEEVKIEKEFNVGDKEGRYVYQVSCKENIYILKGFKIHLEHLNSGNKKSKELFMKSLIQISEVFQEYYFSRAASLFNPHIAAPLFMDFTIDLAENESSYSYMCIEIIFEHGGTSLSNMQPTTLELTYNLMRQSANALFLLHNLNIVHFDIKPANMVYDKRKDLLKIIDMGSAFGQTNKKNLTDTTTTLEKKIRSGTLGFAPPEVVSMAKESVVDPELKLSLAAVDIYCWGMSFFALLTNRKNNELAKDYEKYKVETEKDYEEFIKIIEICFNSVKAKKSKEKELKKAICSLLNKALQYKPKERPTMKDVISEMKEFEKEKNYTLPYSKTELEHNRNMLKILMDSDDFNKSLSRLSSNKKDVEYKNEIKDEVEDEVIANDEKEGKVEDKIEYNIEHKEEIKTKSQVMDIPDKLLKLSCEHEVAKDYLVKYALKLEEHFENYDKMKKELSILKKLLNEQELSTSAQQKIKEDIKNIEDYYKEVDKAKAKLEEHEKELKKEVPIVEMFENIKRLEDDFDVPELNDETKEILLAQNDEEKGLKQAESELQVCLENKISGFINEIQESATRYANNANKSRQDVTNLKMNYKQMKQKYADKEAKLMKAISEKSKIQEELNGKNNELIQENEKLLEGNEKLKKEKEKYEDEIKSKAEITKEIENLQSKLSNITAEIEKKLKKNKKLENKNNKQTLALKTITGKLAITEKYISEKEKELNEVKGKVEAQKHNLDKLNKKCSEEEKAVLVKVQGDTKEEIVELKEKKDLVQEYDLLKTMVEDLIKVKEDYTKENLELKKQRHQLESELKGLREKYTEENKEHEKIKNETKALCNQKDDLESKVNNFNEKFMELNKKELQSYKQKVKEKVIKQKNKLEKLLSQYTELDRKHKLQNSELDNLKSELSSAEQDNKKLIASIAKVEEEYGKEKQVLSNFINDLKGKISKHDHALYSRLEEIKKYMEEVKNSLKTRINELANHIKEVNEKVVFRAKEVSKVFGKLRKLCKNKVSNVNYISNEQSSPKINIDLNKRDMNQIYINIKEIIQRMNNAYSKIKNEKETKIKRLNDEIVNHNNSIEEYKKIIKNKEAQLTKKPEKKEEKNCTSCAARKQKEVVKYVIGKKYTVSVHEHPLIYLEKDNGWGCDGRRIVGGCKSGFTGFYQTGGALRFRCVGCDYDLCVRCLEAYLVN